jgi:hypothetical protein
VPAPDRTRCHAHGGAPGAGAPKGNRNAVTHGRYVGGRDTARARQNEERKQLAAEMAPIHRLERAALELDRGRPPRCKETRGTVSAVWGPERERQMLVNLKEHLERDLKAKKAPLSAQAYSATYACHLALRLLCAERPCFASRQALLAEICRVFSLGYDAEWLSKVRGVPSMISFVYIWRRFCAAQYEKYFPVAPKKPRTKVAKATAPADKPQSDSDGSLRALIGRLELDPNVQRLPDHERGSEIRRAVRKELGRIARSSDIPESTKDLARSLAMELRAEIKAAGRRT